ncbi:MAG: polysaccharide deacetylase family protein [Bacteroidales bacterium]|jgi:hypothetical protein|nr:polysaccharide deacetylase family protein [Bacteroidales bacterium]
MENENIYLTVNAIKYTIKHLLMIACPEFQDQVLIEVAEDRKKASALIGTKKIIFQISHCSDILSLITGGLKLNKIATIDGMGMIPIPLEDGFSFAEVIGNELFIYADIIPLSFIMLSRCEEAFIQDRDVYGRFESKHSIATKYNFIDYPIVDEYALILQKYLKILFPENTFVIPKCTIIPSHDIDEVRRFSSFKKSIRTLLGDIYLSKNIFVFFRSVIQYIRSFNRPANDPYITAINELLNISHQYNLISEFYFMGAVPNKYDCGYDPNQSQVRDVFLQIDKINMIIGYHASFETLTDENLYSLEKQKIELASNKSIIYARQHYLRFDIHSTFRNLEKAGILYDSTLGYADREGFRCGTCYDFHPYDLKNDVQFTIKERPLIVMDMTLFGYKKYTIKEAHRQIVKLYQRCKIVGGNFTILWHNNSVTRKRKWFKKLYCNFLKKHNGN